jgi:uncharacterized repeat protein (TIGR01451 family)
MLLNLGGIDVKTKCVLILLSLYLYALAQEPVSVATSIYKVEESGELTLATTARVGQIVHYVLKVSNDSQVTLPSYTVIITGPIPAGTSYVPGSASQFEGIILEETASAIEWTFERPMEPNETVELSYRVSVGLPTAGNPQNSGGDDINSKCSAEWGSDTDMVDYCIKNQRAAKLEISNYSGLIRTNCETEWGADYEMVLYCIKNQSSAQQALQGVPEDEILTKCQGEWGTDYEMVEYCVKNQTEARTIVVAAPNDEITLFCTNEWGTDYEMVAYCMKNQRAAKQSIQNYSGPVRQACEQEWGTDYEMVEYCIRNQ